MAKTVAFTNPEGMVEVLIINYACGLTIEQIFQKDVPAGATDAAIINTRDIPLDKSYRGAWTFKNKVFGHDMVKAKELHKEKLRQLRAPKLAELDVEYQKADEEGKPQVKAQIAAKKKKLRDITDHPSIEAAQTIEELKVAAMSELEV